MSRILYFGRYIFYRGLMFQRLKIIEYKELCRSDVSRNYIVYLMIYKSCNYSLDFKCTYINFDQNCIINSKINGKLFRR